MILGLFLGLPAGYLGGWIDGGVIVMLDALQALPTVVLALTLLALLGGFDGQHRDRHGGLAGAEFCPRRPRLGPRRAADSYVEAERLLGASTRRMPSSHILPNIAPPMFVLVAIHLPNAIAVETGLSFLGLGVRPPTPSWGVILSDGFDRVRSAPWAVIWTCLALGITTLGFTLLGEGLRDVLDPKRPRAAP